MQTTPKGVDVMPKDVVEHVEVAVSRLLRYCPSYRTEAPWQAGHLESNRQVQATMYIVKFPGKSIKNIEKR